MTWIWCSSVSMNTTHNLNNQGKRNMLNLKQDNDVQKEKTEDRVNKGYKVADTDIYLVKAKQAYFEKTKNGATMMTAIFVGADEKEFRMRECIISGNDKGNKPYYVKDGKKYPMPGYSRMNDMMLLVMGEELGDIELTEGIVQVYRDGKNVNETLDVVDGFNGNEAVVGVFNQISQKTDAKNNYEPIPGQYRNHNEINKFFHPDDNRTVSEIVDDKEAKFYDEWLENYKGKVVDEKGVVIENPEALLQNQGNAGKPASPFASATKNGEQKANPFQKK